MEPIAGIIRSATYCMDRAKEMHIQISKSERHTLGSALELGRILLEAKSKAPQGWSVRLIEAGIPYGRANEYMRIAGLDAEAISRCGSIRDAVTEAQNAKPRPTSPQSSIPFRRDKPSSPEPEEQISTPMPPVTKTEADDEEAISHMIQGGQGRCSQIIRDLESTYLFSPSRDLISRRDKAAAIRDAIPGIAKRLKGAKP